MAPQYISITDNFDWGLPRLEIENVETMLLADSMNQEAHKDLTGVNLLYLAPEYFTGMKCNWKADVWSIGTILYLLVTGGVEDTGRRCTHKEPRDFREPIWYNLPVFMLDFMKRMIQAN